MKRAALLVVISCVGVLAAPLLYDLFFEICDWLYRIGVQDHWL